MHKSFVFLLLASLAACSGQDGAAPALQAAGNGGGRGGRGAPGGGAAVPVTTIHVEAKAVPLTIPAVGTMEAVSTVQIRAQVTGQLSEVHFAEGQEVRKGQELFTLDPRPFEAALQQAEAVLARDTATANNAKAQDARYEDLFKRGLIPRDQYETQQASVQALQATLDADRATVQTARLNLSYARISAPISGRTGALAVHVGDLVRANDTNPLVTINQLAPIYGTFAVPGRYLQDIRRYQLQKPLKVVARAQASVPPGAQPPPPPNPALMARPGAPTAEEEDQVATAGGPTAIGTVTFIDNAVDTTTGTIKLKATFPNTDHALWPGLFVQVTLQLTSDPNAIVVPAVAVQTSQSGQYVYIVKPDRTVEMREVTVQRQEGEQMVIARGLTPGEEVVTDGQLRLTPGAHIVRPGEQPPAGGPGGGRNGRNGRGGGRGSGRTS